VWIAKGALDHQGSCVSPRELQIARELWIANELWITMGAVDRQGMCGSPRELRIAKGGVELWIANVAVDLSSYSIHRWCPGFHLLRTY